MVLAVVVGAAAGCAGKANTASASPPGVIRAVGVENQYANVIGQIGGRYVQTTAAESNPNTDPHAFEATAAEARRIAGAQLVVRNGAGYDTWAAKLEAASPNPKRKEIDVQRLLGRPTSMRNPHLWYQPATMPAVAKAVAADLTALEPAHAGYFAANERVFVNSLHRWLDAIARFKATYPGTPVAVTEPVGDYMLQAAGCHILTPFSLQAAIMNGTDPSPQDVAAEDSLFTGHRVKVFVYNQQVTDSLTESFLALARKEGIPTVGVYETMPTPGYNYQSWMLAEVIALDKAVVDKVSTTRL
ncbi:MAG: metal ABC transporter solute-binding protein, Zn/Mn family [Acidimicrobiales bacterium]